MSMDMNVKPIEKSQESRSQKEGTGREEQSSGISLRTVTGGYDDALFLQIEALDFEMGKLTCIIGSNGSGKSTLLRTMIGLLPYEGSIQILGEEGRTLTSKARARKVSFLPQTLVPANLDVKTLVCHGRFAHLSHSRTLRPEDLSIVEQAMERTDVQDLQGKLLRDLSGGERQRAYLAMIIAQDTPFLLLDEPTTYMDVSHQIRIMSILEELKAEGKGIILTSHDLPQSATYSDRMILMQEGHVVADGEPATYAADHIEKDEREAGDHCVKLPSANVQALAAAMQVGLKELPEGEYLYRYELVQTREACLEFKGTGTRKGTV